MLKILLLTALCFFLLLINIYYFGLQQTVDYSQIIPHIILTVAVITGFHLSERLRNLPQIYTKLSAGFILLAISQANLISSFITNQPFYIFALSEFLLKAPGLILILLGFLKWLHVKEERERILSEQEEKWKTIVEGVNDIIIIIQNDTVKYVNSKIKEILGYEPDEIKGRKVSDVLQGSEIDQIYNKIIKSNISSRSRIALFSKNGKKKVFDINPSIIKYEGKPAIIGILRDVTERFEREEEILRTKEKLEEVQEKLFEAQRLANVGYWEINPENLKVKISLEASKILCGNKKRCVSTLEQFNSLIVPQDRKGILEMREKAIKNFIPYEARYRISSLEGEKIIREKVKIMTDRTGKKFLLGIIQDITEIYQMYQKVLENEERYRNLFDYSNDAIIITDLEGNILDVNKKTVYKLGFTKEDLSLLNIKDIFGSTFKRVYPKWLKRIYINGFLRFETQVETFHKNSFPSEVSASIFEIKGKKYIQFIIRDITERKIAEKEIRLASIVFDNALEGIVITDGEGTVLRSNTAFTDLTGYDRKEIVGWHISELPVICSEKDEMKKIWKFVRENGKWQGELIGTKRNGENFVLWLSLIQVKNRGEITNYIAIISDITERKHKEEKLKNLAYYDNLTGLPNRVYFFSKLKSIFSKTADKKVALFFIDLDGFKQVNDSYGHEVGDKLLKKVAQRLKSSVRKDDFVARLAGDEFIVLIEGVDEKEVLRKISDKIIKNVGTEFIIDGKKVRIGASIGISILPEDAQDIETFLKNADFAMYHSKLMGKNRYTFYSDIINNRS